MRARTAWFLMAAVLLIPCICQAQTQSGAVTQGDIAPFLGQWTGQHDECRSAANCESRSVHMTITEDTVTYTLSAADGGFARHTKSTSGPSSKSYPAKFEKAGGVTTMSFTTQSGNKIKFSLSGGRLTGKGTGGRFIVKYNLTKAGR
ncbi:MAG TPA: hypothetical protein PK250_11375 [Syntrophobacter fumaroxidans]|nr:hypothetical protein [Syntrophobacter fumaroxidans]